MHGSYSRACRDNCLAVLPEQICNRSSGISLFSSKESSWELSVQKAEERVIDSI